MKARPKTKLQNLTMLGKTPEPTPNLTGIQRVTGIQRAERIAFLLCIVAVVLDLFLWRP